MFDVYPSADGAGGIPLLSFQSAPFLPSLSTRALLLSAGVTLRSTAWDLGAPLPSDSPQGRLTAQTRTPQTYPQIWRQNAATRA